MSIIEENVTLSAQVAELGQKLKAAIAALAAANAELDASKVAAAEQIAAAGKAKADAESAVVAANDALATERRAHGDTKAKLEAAETRLANPGYVAAAAPVVPVVPEGGATAAPTYDTREEALIAYRAIADPKEREEFRNTNKQILGL